MKFPDRHAVLVNMAWLAVFVLAYIGVRAWQHRGLVRGPAPVFTAVTLDGQPLSLAGLRGRPVLIHFWATWCHICRMEQGAIDALGRNHTVVTVAIDADNRAALVRYVQQHGIRVPVVADVEGSLSAQYGVRAVPTDFIVDGNGNIRFEEIGYSTKWGLVARLWIAGNG